MIRLATATLLTLVSAGMMLAGAGLIQDADNHPQAIFGLMLSLAGASCLVGMVLVITGRRA